MRVKTWKVLDYGSVPVNSKTIPYECKCGCEAHLPVLGRVEAVMGTEGEGDAGIFFDPHEVHAIPKVIACRRCRRILTTEE